MEKTPGYFHTNGVPEKMWRTNNKTKLVLIVRNPVDRLVSDYNQFRYSNSIILKDFLTSLTDLDPVILRRTKAILR